MQVSVHLRRVGQHVLIEHDGHHHGLTWSHAQALYYAAKPHLADAAAYDASGQWSETPASEVIAGLQVTRMGLMVQLVRHGRLWIDAPYQHARALLKGVYRLAKEIEADDARVAIQQIEDMAVLYVTAAPLGLSLDRRKIDEALKKTSNGIPPLGIVPPPTLIGGTP